MYIFNILLTLSMVLLARAEWSYINLMLAIYMAVILILSSSIMRLALFSPERPFELERYGSINPITIVLSMTLSLVVAGTVIYTSVTWLTHLMIAYMIIYNVALMHFWRCQIAWVKYTRMDRESDIEQALQEAKAKVGS